MARAQDAAAWPPPPLREAPGNGVRSPAAAHGPARQGFCRCPGLQCQPWNWQRRRRPNTAAHSPYPAAPFKLRRVACWDWGVRTGGTVNETPPFLSPPLSPTCSRTAVRSRGCFWLLWLSACLAVMCSRAYAPPLPSFTLSLVSSFQVLRKP